MTLFIGNLVNKSGFQVYASIASRTLLQLGKLTNQHPAHYDNKKELGFTLFLAPDHSMHLGTFF